MKKYVIYIGILFVGLLLGWFLFGGSSNDEATHNHNEETEKNQKWTCSMHPQIMQQESGACPICGMDLIPAESSAEGLAADQFKLTKNAMALANIQTTIVGTNNVSGTIVKLSGKIVENEDNMAVQTAHFSGRIEKLHISSKGEKIRKGQLLALIYSPELVAAQQELLTASLMKDTQPALYKAVRNKLKLWKLSENQINQIENSKRPIVNFPVYANVSGIVSEKIVEEGNHVMEGAPLLKISNLSTVWANFDVYENQISLFKVGQEVVITTNSYSNKEFKSKVTFIDPILDAKTRIVKMRVVLANTSNLFKPGMFVEGEIKGIDSNDTQVLMIPASSILWTGKRSVVYLKINADSPVFEMREITIGNKIGDAYKVLDGLNVGDEVVTNGTFTIDAAAQLKGKKSMMNKDGGKTSTGHEGHGGMNTMNSSDEVVKIERIKVSTEFQEQLKKVFDDYITLKNALVNDDFSVSKNAANTMILNLNNIDMALLKTNKAHASWMPVEKQIKTSANSIKSTSSIEEQRKHFINLSSNLILAVQMFGVNEKVYSQFCPMANNDKGAYWLSSEKEIKNPYFGASMLACGDIVKEIE